MRNFFPFRATARSFSSPIRHFRIFFFRGISHLIYAILVGRTLCLSYLEFGIIDNFYLFLLRPRSLLVVGAFFSRWIALRKLFLLVEFLFVYFFASFADCFADLFLFGRSRCLYRLSYYYYTGVVYLASRREQSENSFVWIDRSLSVTTHRQCFFRWTIAFKPPLLRYQNKNIRCELSRSRRK